MTVVMIVVVIAAAELMNSDTEYSHGVSGQKHMNSKAGTSFEYIDGLANTQSHS